MAFAVAPAYRKFQPLVDQTVSGSVQPVLALVVARLRGAQAAFASVWATNQVPLLGASAALALMLAYLFWDSLSLVWLLSSECAP
jgi:hypothetical protein